MNVPIICPTHGRAGQVTAFQAFGDDLTLCVAVSQEEAYRDAYPAGQLLVHPDEIIGSSQKRGWLYERYGTVFMVDDDVGQMLDFTEVPTRKVPPAEARSIVQATADTAKQLGAVLWGFPGTANPITYKPARPFKLSPGVQLGCAMGLHPSKHLYFPQDHWTHEDVFISGLNAYYHRFAFQDTRYGLPATFDLSGGRRSQMTTRTMEMAWEQLEKAFGESFVRPKYTENGNWMPKLKIPW